MLISQGLIIFFCLAYHFLHATQFLFQIAVLKLHVFNEFVLTIYFFSQLSHFAIETTHLLLQLIELCLFMLKASQRLLFILEDGQCLLSHFTDIQD